MEAKDGKWCLFKIINQICCSRIARYMWILINCIYMVIYPNIIKYSILRSHEHYLLYYLLIMWKKTPWEELKLCDWFVPSSDITSLSLALQAIRCIISYSIHILWPICIVSSGLCIGMAPKFVVALGPEISWIGPAVHETRPLQREASN